MCVVDKIVLILSLVSTGEPQTVRLASGKSPICGENGQLWRQQVRCLHWGTTRFWWAPSRESPPLKRSPWKGVGMPPGQN